MLNKYLTKINQDFESTNWDVRIKNHDGSSFPENLSDKLILLPESDKSHYLFFVNSLKTTGRIDRKTKFKRSWLLPTETKAIFAMFLNHKLSSSFAEAARSCTQKALAAQTKTSLQLHELTQDIYNKVISSVESSTVLFRYNEFINWSVKNGYCEFIRTQRVSSGGVYDGAKRKKDKLPEVSSILALGDIFYQTIPKDREEWDTSPNSPQANALVAMYSALCLAAPNRMCAEVLTLPKQKVSSVVLSDRNGKKAKLHSLVWQGSKNYKDNEKHIGSWMIEPIERGIEYFDLVTKPYRVLAAFWTNQKSTIEDLFPQRDSSFINNLKNVNLGLSDIPTFIQLGYLLGFYQNDTFKLNVLGSNQRKSKVHISELDANFQLFLNQNCGLDTLLGLKTIRESTSLIYHNQLKLGHFATIGKIQNCLFADIIRNWPSFPELSMGENANRTLLSEAMWCLNAHSMSGKNYYKLVDTTYFEGLLDRKLCKGELLKDFGFSSRLRVTPHKLRHFINHYGYVNGIPDYILNIWSGRQDSQHLISYIHENEEDKLARVPLLTESIKSENISVKSERDYAKAKNLVTGATSRTSVGFCSKDLRYSPCTYLSEFETQCTFCEQSCHIAHDEDGIRVLKEDHRIQCERLEHLLSSRKTNNHRLKKWYKMHKANTFLLSQLIDILEDPSVRKGSVVRVITDTLEIRIADLKAREIMNKEILLNVMDDEIQEGLKLLELTPLKTKRDKELEEFLDDLWSDL
ncbi:hypothetical protein [Vibrio mediterranei]|uniref:hypothetical protein n=1 Tax=Vibrio mediterranei TaxID=689 RepID=UPI00148D28AE|nr:hypothetical protein [Vibrio mediterranei]NOI25943.1 hypothetical protein [Vibrio mediterranei]